MFQSSLPQLGRQTERAKRRVYPDLPFAHVPERQYLPGCAGMVPILRLVPLPGSRVFHQARTKMFSVGHELVEQSKLAAAKETAGEPFSGRRDLLSLLLKANLSADIPERQRLSDEEVIGQIPTFLLAGHETTSSAIAWALHSLSLNQEAQTKLREEVLAVSSDSPTMEELNSLIWLECVVRENMRLHAPVVFTTRMAMHDDVLPLGKPYIDQNGRMHDSLPIRKGQIVHIPILAVNTDREIWGPDAEEFKPERWENVPKAANNVPGMWANLLTFFAGLHNCIGFRFSLAEQKALLFVLIRALWKCDLSHTSPSSPVPVPLSNQIFQHTVIKFRIITLPPTYRQCDELNRSSGISGYAGD
ncbi:cytochrome P450 [Mycena albidolilacea]|uniref:Cytochrome P450 n=1 Tax=Mycena albidolilacea TaxID=1033008 RepID=A0AAD7A960_9AGAR|nr:cytochrome P450 [Mycena albidolilacea]